MAEKQASRTVAQKMGIKPGSRGLLVQAPSAAVDAMELPELDLADSPAGDFDYIHLFVTQGSDMRERFGVLRHRVRRAGMLWVSWPKGGKLGTDLNMKSVISIGYDLNMVESICLRVDDVWAGLKFTHPKTGKTYTNSYGALPLEPHAT